MRLGFISDQNCTKIMLDVKVLSVHFYSIFKVLTTT